MVKEQVKRKKAHEKRNETRTETIQVGDQVVISNEIAPEGQSKSLQPKYKGPMTVLEVNKQNCIVESSDKKYRKAIHLSRLHKNSKPSTTTNTTTTTTDTITPSITKSNNNGNTGNKNKSNCNHSHNTSNNKRPEQDT
jgi:hypothetical protein